jgi:archaellum component FlaC
MDYESRIVKLETEMENQKEAIALLRVDINKLDNKVESLRGEILTLTRWVAGLVLANATLIAGITLKFAGAI